MQIDPALQSNADNYKLLTNLVVPRPIAWVSTLSQSGVVNLAPFSFFNALGSDPVYLIISVGRNDKGELKDTERNIQATGEFVVNMVTEDLFDHEPVGCRFSAGSERTRSSTVAHRTLGAHQDAARGKSAGEYGMQAFQRAATRRQHAVHW